jgi:hypothetical protein
MKIRGSVNKFLLSTVAACLAASFLLVAGLYIAEGSRLQGKSSNVPASARSASSSAAAKRSDSKVLEAFGKLPLTFMENQGQTAQEVRYVSHGSGYDLFLTSQEAVVALRSGKHFDLSPRHRAQSLKAMHELRRSGVTTTALRMQFEGANPQAQIAGAEKLPGAVNYFVGNDTRKWRGGIPTYAQVKYTQVYPGVDLVFYGNQNKLEYDFIVAPGADPNVIRLSLSGAKKMRVNAHGDVVVTVPGGAVALQKPLVYQNIAGRRREIAGRYALKGDHVSFAVASYDRRQPLIVDPILNYSTYVGGGDDDNTGYGLAVDGDGNAYISGQTFSTDFPTKNPLATTGGTNSGNASGQAFVTELSASGALVFSTYLGGTAGGDAAFGIALDPSGNIYVTGETVSIDFPTTSNALKQSPLPSNAEGTSFLTKLTSAGALSYSSYIGGTNNDFGNAVAADASGNAYITGTTASAPGTTEITFPVTTDAYQSTLGNAQGNAFLTRIDTTQSGNNSLIYSTYLGGDDAYEGAAGFPDEGFGIAVDTAQHAFIGGVTTSANFPTNGTVAAHQAAALNTTSSAFVAEFDTTLGTLLYSSYLGGSGGAGGGDFGTGVDLLSGTSKVYITGVTNSLSDFGPPTTGAYQTTGDADAGAAFVAVTDTSSGALNYSTYLGSSGTTGWSIKADAASHNALVGGGTSSTTLPVTMGAYQTSLAAGAPGDGFIAEIGPNGNGSEDLGYLSYFGGSGSGGNPDQIFGIAIGTLPTVYVAGQTYSINLPSTTGNSLDGDSDAFVASLTLNAPELTVSATTLSFNSTAVGTAAPTQTVTLTNNTNSAITFTGATATTTTPALATDFSATTACTSIPALGTCTITVGYTPSVSTNEAGNLAIVDGAGTQTVALTGTVGAVPPGFTLSAAPSTLTVARGSDGTATITVTSVGGFNAAVALACTGQPRRSTCSLSPTSVTPTAGGSGTSTLTFDTKSLLVPAPDVRRLPPGSFRILAPVALALMILLLFASEQRLRTRLTMVGALVIFVALAGCNNSNGTPKGTYTLTVTGTSSGVTTQTATIAVTVTSK